MYKIFSLIFLFFFLACASSSTFNNAGQINPQIKLTNQESDKKSETPLEKLEFPHKITTIPDVQDFGIFQVKRNSNQKDENGWNAPPYEDAEIYTSFYHEPIVNEKITIVPLKVNFEPFQLKVLKTTKQKTPCEEETSKKLFYWDTKLEKINNKEILEFNNSEVKNAEMPFEVFGIYPAVQFARNIPSSELKSEMLPKGVSVQTVAAAIDLNNDSKPDLLETYFCCSDESKSPNDNCEYLCQKSFKKVNGTWKLINFEKPC